MKSKLAISILLIGTMFAAFFAEIPAVKADWPPVFDQYGPHVDQVLIKLYANENAEFQALETGNIDLIDWPLTGYWINRWSNPPYSDDINMMDYGGEFGLYAFDINNNETTAGTSWEGWRRLGSSPWLSAADYPSNYITQRNTTDSNHMIGCFTFGDLPAGLTVSAVQLRIKCWSDDLNDGMNIYLHNGTEWSSAYSVVPTNWLAPGSYMQIDVTSCLNTVATTNAASMLIEKTTAFTEAFVGIDHAYLSVTTDLGLWYLNVDGISALKVDNIGRLSAFRHALAHLTDRAYVISTILQGFGSPAYTMVPPALGGWVNTGVDQHPYNPALAASILARGEDGILGTADDIKDNDGDGYYDWPSTTNTISIDLVVRSDLSPGMKEVGTRLKWELTTNIMSYSGGVGFQVWTRWVSGDKPFDKLVVEDKSFTICTSYRMIPCRDPYYLFTWYHSWMYWHPGACPNYCNVNDPELDAYLYAIYGADNKDIAMVNTYAAQAVFANKVFGVPVYASNAPKAGRTEYTGGTNGNGVIPDDGENLYRGLAWQGFVNQHGFGLNSWWSFLNAHPEGYEFPALNTEMRLRYGFKVLEVASLNPLYAHGYWDWEIMGKVYDTLLRVNPYDLSEDLEWVAKRFEIGTWDNAGEPATKLTFELRDDVYWHDGQQLDATDLVFTILELDDLLIDNGYPPPWFYSNVLDVNSINVINQYKVEIKLNLKSYFALHWIGELPILPEHIWRPIVTTGNPEGFAPDPQLIGAGPFKVYSHHVFPFDDYYIPSSNATLDAYRGYFNQNPIRVSMAVHGSYIDAYLKNYDHAAITVTVSATADGIPLTGGGTVNVPGSPDEGSTPGVVVVRFSGLSPPITLYNIVVTVSYTFGGQPISDTFSRQLRAPSIDGDITNDGTINVQDAIHLAFHFGLKAYTWPEDDINYDKNINVLDAVILINNWGQTAP